MSPTVRSKREVWTFFRLNKLYPHSILKESNFNLRKVNLYDLDIPRETMAIFEQVETLRCLIWVFFDCKLPFWEYPDYMG